MSPGRALADIEYDAQSFTTGGNPAATQSPQVHIWLDPLYVSGKSTSVKIRNNNADNEPGDLVATLTNPGTLTADSLNTFTAPARYHAG